jgi:hypothetical protein
MLTGGFVPSLEHDLLPMPALIPCLEDEREHCPSIILILHVVAGWKGGMSGRLFRPGT